MVWYGANTWEWNSFTDVFVLRCEVIIRSIPIPNPPHVVLCRIYEGQGRIHILVPIQPSLFHLSQEHRSLPHLLWTTDDFSPVTFWCKQVRTKARALDFQELLHVEGLDSFLCWVFMTNVGTPKVGLKPQPVEPKSFCHVFQMLSQHLHQAMLLRSLGLDRKWCVSEWLCNVASRALYHVPRFPRLEVQWSRTPWRLLHKLLISQVTHHVSVRVLRIHHPESSVKWRRVFDFYTEYWPKSKTRPYHGPCF